jgi:hypothetical protein
MREYGVVVAIVGEVLRRSSRVTVDGLRSSRRAISRMVSPWLRKPAMRCRSTIDRYRFDRTASANRSGATPPASARQR